MSSGIFWVIGAHQVVLVIKNLLDNAGDLKDMSLIPRLGRSPEGGNGNPLQYSCLENPMVRRAWWATVCGVTKSWTRLKWLNTHAQPLGLVVRIERGVCVYVSWGCWWGSELRRKDGPSRHIGKDQSIYCIMSGYLTERPSGGFWCHCSIPATKLKLWINFSISFIT